MKSAGKNETLTNRKAVMLMMTALVAVIMILLAVFWLSESQEIRIRAEKSIRQTMVNEAYEDRTLPPAYEFYTEELAEGILNEAETDLLNHYNENRSQYMSGMSAILYMRCIRRWSSWLSGRHCRYCYSSLSAGGC